ncbi:twin-arginine translocase subunit TatB [Niveispirillum lacus]|uniref:Sec-independent protein translocase protein TatB n=1 Tax=Niveispirillum lacus TaxID=1981099 RepID=A0A255Z8G3_9PROT|nr:Sec-independent protein translocase protein TatB [Niveispirillum lacus]OYQ37711.1 twin-arginine translocase subunit TatB [Niveispirillum lacus]
MFDIGWSELLVIGVVALIVIGPKDLPKALSTLGKWMARARSMAREFQNNVDDMVRQAELDELREQVQKARSFNLTDELEKSIDPDGGMRKSLAVEDFTSPAQNNPAPTPVAALVDASGEDIADLASAALAPAPAPVPSSGPHPAPVAKPITGTPAPDVASAKLAAASVSAEPSLHTDPSKDKTP